MARADKTAILDDLMMDHVPYEVAMMRATHDGLVQGLQGTCLNAYIESFAIHARSLINFFNGKDGCRAEDFTDSYTPFACGRVPKRLTDKLNQQIPHITEKRFNSIGDKLNGADITELRTRIDRELDQFLAHMKPHYKEIWDTKKSHLRP
jgi:hypothetical protein